MVIHALIHPMLHHSPLSCAYMKLASLIALSLFSLSTSSSHAIEPLRYVATGARIGVNFDPNGGVGTLTSFWHRTPHQLGGPVAQIQIGFMNWILNYSNENASPYETTINYAWIERASDGQVVPITFSGSRQLIMPANDTEPYWLADPIDSSVWTGGTPQRDEIFWVHIKGSLPTDGKACSGSPTSYSGTKFIYYDPANDPGTYDFAGTVPTISGQSVRSRGLPLMFLGRYTGPGYLSVIGIGDSILDGSGDWSKASLAGFGFFCRAALDDSGENTIATFNLTRHGATSTAVTKASNPRQQHFLKYANVAVEEYGTNDLNSNGTGNVATITGTLETIWTMCRDAGIQHIVRTQLMPRTDSTDSWATKENQTPRPEWGEGEKRDEFNDFFATALTEGKVDIVLQNLELVCDPTDSGYWMSDGSGKLYNADSAHLNSAGNALLAPPLRSALLSLTVDENAPRYSAWVDAIDWGGLDASPEADPNQDGISNALAYALDLSPLDTVPASDRPYATYDAATAGGPWLNFIFRENVTAEDVIFDYLSTLDLSSNWSSLVVDDVNVIEETLDADPDGDGSAVLKKVRVKLATEDTQRFLKLEVIL